MAFYLVHDDDRDRVAWLFWAQPETGRAFSYLPNWGTFFYNRALSIDFGFDQEMRYEQVSARRATEIIAEGAVGRLDGRKSGWFLDRLEGVETREVDELLGQEPLARPRGRGREAARRAQEVDQAPAGDWVTYRTFDREDRVKANVCATDLRTGRIRAFAGRDLEVATFDSRDGDHIVVRLRRRQPDAETMTTESTPDLVGRAEKLARSAHQDQVDKAGQPYIDHPARVAGRMDDDDDLGQITAWLHDTVEDTTVTLEDLAESFPAEVVAAVDALTRRPDEDDAYYARVRSDPIALRVKIADIADNTDPDRLAKLPAAEQDRLTAKYRHALQQLQPATVPDAPGADLGAHRQQVRSPR